MESIDDLLAQIKSEYQEQQPEPNKKPPLFLEEELNVPSAIDPTIQPQLGSITWLSSAEENLLAEIKAEFEEQDYIEEHKKEQQRQAEQQKAEQERNRQRESLIKDATEWLKTLDPHSEEGLWFEELAYSYPSKLDAAMEYLQTLRQN